MSDDPPLSDKGKSDTAQVEPPATESQLPRLFWDQGTAYDLFMSLNVLHNPEEYGLRASWAAGVRSRLSVEERRTLEEAELAIQFPFHWIYALPTPKDGSSVLWALRQLPAGQRLPALALPPEAPGDVAQKLLNVASSGSWDEGALEAIEYIYCNDEHNRKNTRDRSTILDIWAHSVDFGERFLGALQSYYQAFYAEEERYVASYLEEALVDAQELAKRVTLAELLQVLSQGLHLVELLEVPELVLVPSYWITPLIHDQTISQTRTLMLFGARPASASLVPGEVIPDALLRGLKAMADPTRLRILRYLAGEQLTPAELSRRLRLRAPTVTHHLKVLRLAGLVHITFEAHVEGRYTARLEAVQGMFSLLGEFLESEPEVLDGV